jgi:hypothetical protein
MVGENNSNNRFSNIGMGSLEGVMSGLDPMGTLFSHITDFKTFGGDGWRGVNSPGSIKYDFIDNNSLLYKIPKAVFGMSSFTFLGIGGYAFSQETNAFVFYLAVMAGYNLYRTAETKLYGDGKIKYSD